MAEKAMLVRFRETDSSDGISRKMLKKLARVLGVSETAAMHKAMAEFAQRHVPQYPRDNGPLTELQQRAIVEIVRKKHGEAVVVESLLDGGPSSLRTVKPGGSKRISASRPR